MKPFIFLLGDTFPTTIYFYAFWLYSLNFLYLAWNFFFFLIILSEIRHPIPAKNSSRTDKAEQVETIPSSGTFNHCTSRWHLPVSCSICGAVWDLIHGPHNSAEVLLPLQFAIICLFDFSPIAVWHCPYWISSYWFQAIFEIHHFAFEACCPKCLHFDFTCKLYRRIL